LCFLQNIADILGVGVATVNELVNKFGNGQLSKSENFTPLLYNIWNTPKQDIVSTFQIVIVNNGTINCTIAKRYFKTNTLKKKVASDNLLPQARPPERTTQKLASTFNTNHVNLV
jgi:hypothetical protein